jgi:hypothetical protein
MLKVKVTLRFVRFGLAVQGGRSNVLVGHVREFLDHRERIEQHWRSIAPSDLVATTIAPFSSDLIQQRRLSDGAVVSTVEELYEAAGKAREELADILGRCVAGVEGAKLKLAPLKQRERALEKATGAKVIVSTDVPRS